MSTESEISINDVVDCTPNDRLNLLFELAEDTILEGAQSRPIRERSFAKVTAKIDTSALDVQYQKIESEERLLRTNPTARVAVTDAATTAILSLLRPACWWRRVLAASVDLTLSSVVGGLIFLVVLIPSELRSAIFHQRGVNVEDFLPYTFVLLATVLATGVLLLVLETAAQSQTLGQRLLGIGLSDYRGDTVLPRSACLWVLSQSATCLTLGLGFFPVLFRKPALHDLVAGISVTRFELRDDTEEIEEDKADDDPDRIEVIHSHSF